MNINISVFIISGNVPENVAARTVEEARTPLYYRRFASLDTRNEEPVQELMREVLKENLGFTISSIYEFTPAYYRNKHLYKDLIIDDRIANIGRTSYQHHCSVSSAATQELLFTNKIHIVYVNHETHRSIPLPDIFLEYFKNRAETIPNINRIGLLKRPQRTFHQKYVIQWGDVDFYLHFNHSEYIRAIFNTMVSFCQKGQFKKLENDLAKYRVEKLTCSYHKEGKPDETMDVHIWESEDNPFVLHGVMDKEGQLAFQCTYEFAELL